MRFSHKIFETKSLVLTVGILVVVAIGGLVQIAPLFYLENTIERVQGVRPLTPLELAGRQLYIREGCYLCHSQMVRPLRDEVERYGHYSLAAESMYDRPFQWGSKRTGPDLARVGGRYSDEWHRQHLIDPRSLVPESVMPPYKVFAVSALERLDLTNDLKTLRFEGVPYTDEMIANAKADLLAQLSPDSEEAEALQKRYPKAIVRDFDPEGGAAVTEMDAIIAYLQVLGTMVDFSTFEATEARKPR